MRQRMHRLRRRPSNAEHLADVAVFALCRASGTVRAHVAQVSSSSNHD